MAILGKRKNKKFSYEPRYYKGKGSPYEMSHKFDEYRTTVGPSRGIKGRFKHAWADLRNNPDRKVNKRVLIIIAVLIFVFLYLIEFDLSIFTQ